jgi:hypothetical protein
MKTEVYEVYNAYFLDIHISTVTTHCFADFILGKMSKKRVLTYRVPLFDSEIA